MASQGNSNRNFGQDFDQKSKDEREKLRQHFLTLSPDDQLKGWDDMWKSNITPWDRNKPNPALVDTLNSKADLFGSPFKEVDGEKVRKKALVPGCGKGYDVLLFASYGYVSVSRACLLDEAPITSRIDCACPSCSSLFSSSNADAKSGRIWS